ncbi:MAG TPA: protein YgfX [Rhodanobacter sp.]
MTSAPAIGFEYSPSRWLPRVSVAVAVLALLALVLCALALWIKLLLIALVLLATWRSMRATSVSVVAAVGLSGDNDWTLRLTTYDDVPATLASFRVLGAFVLLRLHTTSVGTQVVLLAPDNSDADTRRRLRMRLAAMSMPGESARI